ncbi:unnamed protein product [Paramecium sonneborni]|uniref:Uncharacterized protein n=1 Tax=Paramecium sonneborni TaxID=65129 RepID=A0A8S1QSH8_9CILI|nr:unnamed protein product [Paramecium sonneborni]
MISNNKLLNFWDQFFMIQNLQLKTFCFFQSVENSVQKFMLIIENVQYQSRMFKNQLILIRVQGFYSQNYFQPSQNLQSELKKENCHLVVIQCMRQLWILQIQN